MGEPTTIAALRKALPGWVIFGVDGDWPNETLCLWSSDGRSMRFSKYAGYGLVEKRRTIAAAYAAAKCFEGKG